MNPVLKAFIKSAIVITGYSASIGAGVGLMNSGNFYARILAAPACLICGFSTSKLKNGFETYANK